MYYFLFWSFDTVCCGVSHNVLYIVNADCASTVRVTIHNFACNYENGKGVESVSLRG